MTLADLTVDAVLILSVAGLFAGFVNTVAGGGSLVTLPALMLTGLDANVANGTNRVAVLVQSLVAVVAFARRGLLDWRLAGRMSAAAIVGAAAGAWAAARIDNAMMEPLILVALLSVGSLMALRPRLLLPGPTDASPRLADSPSAIPLLLLVGFYGGFLQAGVGYFLLAVLCGVLRLDLVAGNAVKVLIVAAFTLLALPIFAIDGLVAWWPGLILAASSAAGSLIAVRVAVRVKATTLRWIVLATLVATAIAVALR